jgi:RimJ/RimL family protein N-acetyltransferase
MQLSVREIQLNDVDLIIRYWLESSDKHLVGMGVDLSKVPAKETFQQNMEEQIKTPIESKKSYALIWECNGQPIGHCNVNQIIFGKQAYMHLHLWEGQYRNKGMGIQLLKKSMPFFFENLQLEQLFCEPYALNPAPNKTLAKIGFEFQMTHVTIPGSLNFEQEVHLWKLTRENYLKIVL